MFRLLKNNSTIRTFLVMDLLSSFCVGTISTGANWFVLEEGGSNIILSVFLTVNVISSLVFAPIIGIFVDKFSRKKSMLLSLGIRAVVFLFISFFILNNFAVLPSMFLLSAVFGVGWMIYYSSSRSFLQQNVKDKDLTIANSFIEITLQCGMFLSGGITGYLMEKVRYCYILFGATCLLIVTMMIACKLREVKDTPNTLSHDMAGKNNDLKLNRKVISIAIITMLPLFIIQVYNVSMPGYIYNILHAGSSAYGTSDMLYGVGGLLSGIITSKIVGKYNKKSLLFSYFLVLFLSFSLLYFNSTLFFLFILSLIIGLSNSGIKILSNTIMMESIDNKYMGRMSTFVTSVSQFSSLIITLSVGFFNDKMGENFSFIIILFFVFIGLCLVGGKKD